MRSIALLALVPALALGSLSLTACDEPPPGRDAGTRPDSGPRPDGGTCLATADRFPEVIPGRCEARIVDPSATLPVGDDGAGGFIAPGAQRLTPVGAIVELHGFPMRVMPIPGTRWAIVTDGGINDEVIAVVDLDAGAVVDQETFRRRSPTPEALFLGLAVSADGSRIWASGGGANYIWAFDFDVATGALARAESRDIAVMAEADSGYVSGIRLLPDGRTLAVNLLFSDELVLYDVTDNSEIARLAFEANSYPYDLVLTPDGAMAYVSLWNGGAVVPVDLAARTVGTPIAVGKNPEGMALSPDGSRLVVTGSDSDSLTVINLVTGVALDTIWVAGESAPRGASPVAGAFDAAGRLYVVNAGDNAVDVFEPMAESFRRVGRIPTMWYPTDVQVLSDGRVLILNGKHTGTGPNTDPGSVDILDLLGGSLQIVPPEMIDDAALAAWEAEVRVNNERAASFEEVDCGGEAYDFPIPQPGDGPSAVIEHVVLIVRENKTFDAYLGNLTDASGAPHGNGDPTLTLLPPADMDQVLPNTRELARSFAMADNYYSLAEQSVQGHFWATHGRTTDFVERSWLTTWGRGFWSLPPQGLIQPMGYPEEGSIFDYLVAHEIDAANYGEIIGSRARPADPAYPGFFYNMSVRDIEKANFLAEEWAVRCRLRTFSYIVLPNDHTYGLSPGQPTPRSMIADNDEGVGRIVEALSHSTWWPSTAVFVIMDDPQDGGDHVDNHRAPFFVVSPWARRGYVSSVHYNDASLYRTIQLILGVGEPLSAYWANASPMYDMFTSTPDYTPYERIPRRWPIEDNPDDGSEMAAMSRAWDFSQPDEQPGLSRMLWRHFRGTEPPWPIRLETLAEAAEEAAEDADGDVDER